MAVQREKRLLFGYDEGVDALLDALPPVLAHRKLAVAAAVSLDLSLDQRRNFEERQIDAAQAAAFAALATYYRGA